MKYCSNCGKEVDGNLKFCPNCGAPLDDKQAPKPEENNNNYQQNQQSQPTPPVNNGRPRVENRNIVTCIILSIVTCGIYGIIWLINLVNDVNAVCQDEHSNQSGGTVFLLILVTCGIYGIIWFYQVGKRLADAGQKNGIQIADNSTIYLVLALFGLQIVDYCLVQTDLNKFSGQ